MMSSKSQDGIMIYDAMTGIQPRMTICIQVTDHDH